MEPNRFKIWLSNIKHWLAYADNWVIRVVFGLMGLLVATVMQEYAEKKLNVGSLPQYLMVFLVLIAVVFIIRYLKRMEDARLSDRSFTEKQFTEFRTIETKFDIFLDQLQLILSKNFEHTRKELSQTFLQSFRCTFMWDQDQRLRTIAQYVERAEKNIYILSELSTRNEIKKESHAQYLNALNSVIEKKSNDNFTIVRVVVPRNGDHHGSTDWLKSAIKDTSYEKHFKNLLNFGEASLLKFPKGPQDVSILLIDNQFLFLQFNEDYNLRSLNSLLSGGFLFDDFSKSLTKKFQKCFDDMIAKATPIELGDLP